MNKTKLVIEDYVAQKDLIVNQGLAVYTDDFCLEAITEIDQLQAENEKYKKLSDVFSQLEIDKLNGDDVVKIKKLIEQTVRNEE